MKNNCKKRKNPIAGSLKKMFLMAGIFALNVGILHAEISSGNDESEISQQERISVKGQVITDKGESLPGVSVVVKGTSVGTVTDLEGNFTINVPNRDAILTFSFVSFKKTEQKVGNQNFLTVRMMEEVAMLDEAVVIGYQKVTKKDLHGAVTSLKIQDIEGVTAPSVDIMLQGMVPGLNVQTYSGAPGGRNTFNIRGNTSVLNPNEISQPLFVLDGVPVDAEVVGYSAAATNFLTNINPNDIESIDILKDASSASIYGSRAANGVVIINTKKGKSGTPSFFFNSRFGVGLKPKLPEVYGGVAERQKKMAMFESTGTYAELENMPLILTDSLNTAFNNNTDWYDLFFQEAIVQEYNISLTGGNPSMNYRLGFGYYDQEGTMKGTGLDRYSVNANLMNKVSKIFTFNTTLSYVLSNRKAPKGLPDVDAAENAVNLSSEKMPSSLLYLNDIDKKSLLGEYDDLRNENADENVSLSEMITIKLTDYLLFNSQLSYTSFNSRLDYFSPAAISSVGRSEAYSTQKKATTMNTENYFNFDKEFGNIHRLSAVLGMSTNKVQRFETNVSGSYLSSDLIKVVQGVAQEYKDGFSDFDENALVGVFTRVQYFLKDRYSASISLRRDGSSTFGPDKRWGTFPTASLFWTASEEPFMKSLDPYISFLKLRASFGKAGNPPGSSYGYYNRYEVPGTYDGFSVITPRFGDGIGQKDLTWEETDEWNFGLDLEFLKGRFFFQTDLYKKEIKGLFYTLQMPETSGYNVYNTNAASVRNAGVELSLTANILPPSVKDWSWRVMVNAAFNQNMITELPFNNRTIVENARYLNVGHPINQFRMSKFLGVYPTDDDVPLNPYTGIRYLAEGGSPYKAGDAHFLDVDGNYKWVSYQDLTTVGDPNPRWVGGLNSSLRFKNWDLNIQCSFTLKRDVWNQSLARTLSMVNSPYGVDEEGRPFSNWGWGTHWAGTKDFVARRMMVNLDDLNFWQKPGDQADFPRYTVFNRTAANFIQNSSLFLEDGSYFKVNSIMLTYRFPDLKKLYINNLRLSLTAENVLVYTKSRISDPQNVSQQGYYTGNGYGLPRTFTFGLNLEF